MTIRGEASVCKIAGIRKVTVDSNDAAVRFYGQFGFTRSDVRCL